MQGSFSDHFRGLTQTGVDDFHTGVAQGTGNYFGSSIMAVQAGLGN
jgi:hypothetical protein